MRLSCEAVTNSAKIIYSVEIEQVKALECFKYQNKEYFNNLCKNGCINYMRKWCCPPYSPLLQSYASGFENLFIFFTYTELSQFDYIKNNYLKVKAANSILKSRCDKNINNLLKQFGKCISSGSCKLCKPCRCKLNLPCNHPDKMSYSFEALGIDVGALISKLFNKPLLWYKKNYLPEYTSVVYGLLTNMDVDFNGFMFL